MELNTCEVMGRIHERRARYVAKHVQPGAALTLRRDAEDPDGPEAFSLYHERRKIGFIPKEEERIRRSVEAGNHHEIAVKKLIHGDDGSPSAVEIAVNIVAGGEPSPPEPNPVIAAMGDELKILAAIAKAGGRFNRAGRNLIAKFAEVRCREVEVVATEEDANAALKWLKRNLPDEQGLASAIAALSRPDAFDAMLEMSEIIVEADDSASAEEKAAVAKIRSLLSEQKSKAA
jgi:hypothetical protein